MKNVFTFCFLMVVMLGFACISCYAQNPQIGLEKQLIYHQIKTDKEGGILPWYSDDPATAYNFTLNAVWNYWKNIPGHWVRRGIVNEKYPNWRKELKFPPKYLMYRTLDDTGVGGDQFAMMESSLDLYYNYSGNREVLDNMIFQADWYLKYGLSEAGDAWPDIPYPCNTTEAPVYDGDLILGRGFTQPDKAGSFGAELVMLYKKTNDAKYLKAAVKIANTLSMHTAPGDYDHSPLPFKVQAFTGEIKTTYCTNWAGTLRLFDALINMKVGEVEKYGNAYRLINDWMLKYPVKNNRWGPFFEDITNWSDTEINEGTFAWYMLNNKARYPEWRTDVRNMQEWAIKTLGIPYWKQYGFIAMGEQSVYKVQGQSHTSRHASVELLYAALSGDLSKKKEAIKQLNFCTYAVDFDGKCRWMNFDTYEIWWTDGYGDFMRHYLRAMPAAPELAPSFEDHLLSSTSVVQQVKYLNAKSVAYTVFDKAGTETLRLTRKPIKVFFGKKRAAEVKDIKQPGYIWTELPKGGVLSIQRLDDVSVLIIK